MRVIKLIYNLSIFISIVFSCTITNAQDTKGHIPLEALPYYTYNPLTINIGKYKAELLTNDTAELSKLANKIKLDINNTDIESLYFLSIRLYDLGKKDDAFYWFQTAKARHRIFVNMLDKNKIRGIGTAAFELKALFIAINQLVGPYMNGYGMNDIEKGISVLEKVKSEVKDIQSYINIYKDVDFIDESNLEKEKVNKEADLASTIEYVKSHKAEIKKQRIENGTQDKYK